MIWQLGAQALLAAAQQEMRLTPLPQAVRWGLQVLILI